MANPEHVKIFKQGLDAWNKWRMENPGIIPDLGGPGSHGQRFCDRGLFWCAIHQSELDVIDLNRAFRDSIKHDWT